MDPVSSIKLASTSYKATSVPKDDDLVSHLTFLRHEYGDYPGLTLMGDGDDSFVFRYLHQGEKVLKVYSRLQAKIGKSTTHKVVEQYTEDTLRAKEVFDQNPNPTNVKISVEGNVFPIAWVITPQGVVKRDRSIVYTVGQEFIDGTTLMDAISPNQTWTARTDVSLEIANSLSKLEVHPPDIFQFWSTGLYTLNTFIRDQVKPEMDRYYLEVSAVNIKPKINLARKVIEMHVTDLATAIRLHVPKEVK